MILVATVVAVIGIVIMVLAIDSLTKTHRLCQGLIVASLPRTTGQLRAQKPQFHGGPICPAQESISPNVSAQTFW
jgi:hypothetical protein